EGHATRPHAEVQPGRPDSGRSSGRWARWFLRGLYSGKRYNGKELFLIDPNGAPEVSPEEVELMTYDENKRGLWASFHLQGEGDDPANHRGRGGTTSPSRMTIGIPTARILPWASMRPTT